MDKKTILKVFGEAFLRSMVVLMAVAIIGFGAFFLIRVNTDRKQAENTTTEQGSSHSADELQAMLDEENAKDTSDTEEETTEEITTEATTETPDIPSTDKNIMVLNSTSKAGLANSWKNKLSSEGFANVGIGNYSLSTETQTKIYVSEEGMGNDLAEYFTDAVVSVGTLDSGNYSVQGGASMDQIDIFIVIGSNDTTVQ
mgnify:FL=1